MDPTTLTPSAGVVANPAGGVAPALLRPAPVACLAGTVPTLPAYSPPTFHSTMLSIHSVMLKQVRPGAIAFFGDSIMQEVSTQEITPFGMNFGVSGLTIEGLLYKQGDYFEVLDQAGAVVMMIGINNLRTDSPNLANIKDYIMRSINWFTGPLVWSAIVHTGSPEPDRNANLDNVNNHIKSQIASRPKTAIVDINPIVAPSGPLLGGYHGGDGLHWNGATYAVWNGAVKAALKGLIG